MTAVVAPILGVALGVVVLVVIKRLMTAGLSEGLPSTWVLFDAETGDLVDSFDDRASAVRALDEIADPDVCVLEIDGTGHAVGDAVYASGMGPDGRRP